MRFVYIDVVQSLFSCLNVFKMFFFLDFMCVVDPDTPREI